MIVKAAKKIVQLRIDADLEYRLRIEAAKQGRPKGSLLSEALEIYLGQINAES